MDDLVNNIEPEVFLQKLANCIDDGDRASLDGNFLQAAGQYEEALSMLGEQVSFDFEKTRDCLNKLINVHTHLDNKDKLVPLVEQLTQIELVRNVKMLQSSADFFAQRNDREKAVATYRKAFQLARTIRPLNAALLSDLKEAYAEQKSLLPLSDSEEGSEVLENAVPLDDLLLEDLLLDDKLNAPPDETDATMLDASGAVQKKSGHARCRTCGYK